MSYLMDKVDKQREHLTFEEFQDLEFSIYGIPNILVDVVSKLSGQSYEILMFKRLKMINSLKKKIQRRGNVFEVMSKPRDSEEFNEEEREIMILRYRMKHLDFDKYD